MRRFALRAGRHGARTADRPAVGTRIPVSIAEAFARRRTLVAIAVVFATANILINGVLPPAVPLADWSFVLVAGVLLVLLPFRPLATSVAYALTWVLLLIHPTAYASDLLVTTFLFCFLTVFLLLRPLGVLIGTSPFWTSAVTVLAGGSPTNSDVNTLFITGITCGVMVPLGLIVCELDVQRRAASDTLESLRLEIAREMHDLVAYSMSQTALRAQRASLDERYSPEARQEFAALEATASDALHELRLLLRTLRHSTPDLYQDVSTTTGLGGGTTALPVAVQAIADVAAAAGFDVTYRCVGQAEPSMLQASTLSRVAREMGANIMRHGDAGGPVTMTLSLGPTSLWLVSTNSIARSTSPLPRSGTGTLGMRERLNAIQGTLTTLADEDSWICTATVPLSTHQLGAAAVAADAPPPDPATEKP